MSRSRLFLAAMIPFAAPNELKYISQGFGISYDSISNARTRSQNNPTESMSSGHGHGVNGISGEENYTSGSQNKSKSMQSAPQMQMFQTLMQVQGLMGNGKPDIMQLFKMIGNRR